MAGTVKGAKKAWQTIREKAAKRSHSAVLAWRTRKANGPNVAELSNWVLQQQRAYKRGRLTQVQRTMLEKSGLLGIKVKFTKFTKATV